MLKDTQNRGNKQFIILIIICIHFIKKPLSNITVNDVRELHNKIATEKGLYAANRAFELLRAIFNKDAIAYRCKAQ